MNQREDVVVMTINVLWHEWECDGYASVMQRPDGTRYLRMTNHGGPYEADPEELVDRIAEYERTIERTKAALEALKVYQK